jgi:CheY-like chemotaxis protein
MVARPPPPDRWPALSQPDRASGWVKGAPQPEVARTPARVESRASLAPNSTPETARPFTILVIENDATLRGLVRRILLLEGYSVLEAADGALGLRLIETHSGGLDLVLTDIEMPNIDGITVAEVLAALRPLLGVICMSDAVGETEFVERLGLRRQPFLAKPFTREDLVLTTADTLARSQELLAQAQARQAVTSGLPTERNLKEAAVDLVAAARRLLAARARAAPSQSIPVRRATA